jgi:hypothetical protein
VRQRQTLSERKHLLLFVVVAFVLVAGFFLAFGLILLIFGGKGLGLRWGFRGFTSLLLE